VRLVRVDRGACEVQSTDGVRRAGIAPALLAAAANDPATTPCVGDWALLSEDGPDGVPSVVSLLPRRTAILRAGAAPGTSARQVLAANVDVVLVVEGLSPDPSVGRIERLLALAWESGATPVVVLTKGDLVSGESAEALCEEVAAVAPGAELFTVSAHTGDGLQALRSVLGPGITAAMLGPSGAGKSSLLNGLVGTDLMATRALRSDGKGRHTTVHRELVLLPDGAAMIDTPGLRSVGLIGGEGLEQAFGDVEALAADCRFADCAHESEPGCAVLAAVEDGELAERRLASWRKLQREAHWIATRHDARARAAERARWKQVTAEMRRSGRSRP
jgi:ribosome biogenesis GTPase